MLSVIHIAQVVLLALEEDHSESVQGQSTSNVIVQHPGTQVESLVVLASLSQLSLLLGELTHLEVDVRLFHEVTLLNACLGLHDQVLGRLARLVRHRAWSGTQWNCGGVVVRSLASEADISKWVLHN